MACILLSLLFFVPLQAQIKGGEGDGFGTGNFLGSLDGFSVVGMYGGGIGDGEIQLHYKGDLQGTNIGVLYASGEGDGFAENRFSGHIAGKSLAGMFRSGKSDGFDQINSTPIPLEGVSFPIALLAFDAFPQNNFVLLQWITESELNHDFFTIERSLDAREFEALIFTPGAGNSENRIVYEEKDRTPLPGISYYRLKSTDFDGSFSYSHIVEVNREVPEDWEMRIFPNPVSGDQLHIKLRGLQVDKKIQIEMMDIQGKLLYSTSLLSMSSSHILEIPISMSMPSGSYLIRAKQGEEQLSQLFLIR